MNYAPDKMGFLFFLAGREKIESVRLGRARERKMEDRKYETRLFGL